MFKIIIIIIFVLRTTTYKEKRLSDSLRQSMMSLRNSFLQLKVKLNIRRVMLLCSTCLVRTCYWVLFNHLRHF